MRIKPSIMETIIIIIAIIVLVVALALVSPFFIISLLGNMKFFYRKSAPSGYWGFNEVGGEITGFFEGGDITGEEITPETGFIRTEEKPRKLPFWTRQTGFRFMEWSLNAAPGKFTIITSKFDEAAKSRGEHVEIKTTEILDGVPNELMLSIPFSSVDSASGGKFNFYMEFTLKSRHCGKQILCERNQGILRTLTGIAQGFLVRYLKDIHPEVIMKMNPNEIAKRVIVANHTFNLDFFMAPEAGEYQKQKTGLINLYGWEIIRVDVVGRNPADEATLNFLNSGMAIVVAENERLAREQKSLADLFAAQKHAEGMTNLLAAVGGDANNFKWANIPNSHITTIVEKGAIGADIDVKEIIEKLKTK